MSTIHPRYAPNPARAIHVQGFIDQNLVYRLTPQIVSLQNESRDPITVYIDSPGGVTTYMESLLKLLNAPTQDFQDPCWIITAVTSHAASAAADMLAAGDYAVAYPDSVILYHGVRVPSDRPLTAEESLQLAQRLRAGNEGYALKLAREAETRAIFRFISLKDNFEAVREQAQNNRLTDLQCLQTLISERLSESANEVLDKARERFGRYNALLMHVATTTKPPDTYKSKGEMEAAQLKAIVEFERRKNKKDKDWGFLTDGIHRLTDDFFLLHEYLQMFRSARFKQLCQLFAEFLLSDEQLTTIDALSENEKPAKIAELVRPQLQPIWSFFVALCYVLQQGENQLTASDAFWLGLIDEVVGVQDLPSWRVFVEYAREQKAKAKQAAEAEQEKAEAAAGA